MAREKQQSRSCRRAFTLIELVMSITIIAILSGILLPFSFHMVARARNAVTRDSLKSVAGAMKRFHDETGVWPLGNSTWNPSTGSAVGPAAFTTADTALFSLPSSPTLTHCVASSGPMASKCWGGPYLSTGQSLGDGSTADSWGQPFIYAFLPKGHDDAPNGIVVIWSVGANGVNETTSPSTFARGMPADSTSDDIVVVVGAAW